MSKGESIQQQVIDFTTSYCNNPPQIITISTTLSSLGLTTDDECSNYIMELEDHFGLQYQSGDEKGIVTVGDAANLIENKLNPGS